MGEIMNDTSVTPIRVPIDDKETRRRAAVAVGKAYIGHPMWWVNLILGTAPSVLLLESAWQAHRSQLGAAWTVLPVLSDPEPPIVATTA